MSSKSSAKSRLYEPGTGTPPGYRWVTIREDREDHPLQYRHILVRVRDGTIVAGPRAVHGAKIYTVAPDTARRHGLDRARQRSHFQAELTRIKHMRQEMLDGAKAEADAEYRVARESTGLAKRIMEAGGIRHTKDYDVQTIPLYVRRKNGQSLDSLATELGFDNGDALLAALDAERKLRSLPKRVYQENAENAMKHSDEWRMLDLIEQEIREELAEKGPKRRVNLRGKRQVQKTRKRRSA